MAAAVHHSRARDEYLELINRFPLIPIRSEAQYRAAAKLIDELGIIDEQNLSTSQANYLSVLTDLVEKYESEHSRVELSHLTALDSLRFLVRENGMNASDLGRLLGNRQLGSAILRGERQLSKEHIRILSRRFKVAAELFL